MAASSQTIRAIIARLLVFGLTACASASEMALEPGGPSDSLSAAYRDEDVNFGIEEIDYGLPAMDVDAMSGRSDLEGLLVDPSFVLPAYDSGNYANSSLLQAPWGEQSWGIQAASFTDPSDTSVGGTRFRVHQEQAYLFLRENRGELAYGRYVQGFMWPGTGRGPVPWHIFEPTDMRGRVRVQFDIWNNGSERMNRALNYWQLLGLNVWFSSPNFPKAGGDRLGRKPLVIDLVVANRYLWFPGNGLRHFESGVAYHYQVAMTRAREGRWTHYDFDLMPILRRALDHFEISQRERQSIKLYQAEFVLEARNLQASAVVDNFQIRAE